MLASRIRRRVVRGINAALGAARLRLERIPAPVDRAGQDFYRPPQSCQISNLGFLYELAFGKRANGYFVEVGAFDGETFSNSSFLADLGWTGVLIEPMPAFAEMCRERHRQNDVTVVDKAVGASSGLVSLYAAGALSSTSERQIEEYRHVDWAQESVRSAQPVTVELTTLDELLLAAEAPIGFDLLVVDVEGGESAVFEGFDIDHWRPKIMIVELADTHPDLQTTRVADAALGRSIAERGYGVLYKDSINTVFFRYAD